MRNEWGASGKRMGNGWGTSGERVGNEWGTSGDRVVVIDFLSLVFCSFFLLYASLCFPTFNFILCRFVFVWFALLCLIAWFGGVLFLFFLVCRSLRFGKNGPEGT